LATLRQSHPDLLIADLRMPGMSGPELALEVAEICSANPVPIILITSQFDYTTEKDDAINKILGVLTKPIDVNHLRDMIRSIDVVIPQA
jgi:CheY-like chemotaxis protein